MSVEAELETIEEDSAEEVDEEDDDDAGSMEALVSDSDDEEDWERAEQGDESDDDDDDSSREASDEQEVLDFGGDGLSSGPSLPKQKRKLRFDIPRMAMKKRRRGSRKKAESMFSSPGKRARWLKRLQDGFFAASATDSKNSKRFTVERLAKLSLNLGLDAHAAEIYPLSKKTVEEVAAALKGGDYRAADQYLGELRLGHIESDNEISALLARTFANCRRSVLRGIGPAEKAAELQLRLLLIATPHDCPLGGTLQNPLGSYVVAEAWPLREIELANIRIADVRNVTEEESVEEEEDPELVMELCLPISKADHRGTGAKRRLRCECASNGKYLCGPHALLEQWETRVTELGGDPDDVESLGRDILGEPLFCTLYGDEAPKQEVINAWQQLAPPEHPKLGGHTPRRSGAKRRAREGWPLNLIMLLGRWASAAVLGYVEEAMTETAPGFRQQLQLGYDNWEEALPTLSKRVSQLEGKLKGLRESASRNLKELQKKFETAEKAKTEEAKERR